MTATDKVSDVKNESDSTDKGIDHVLHIPMEPLVGSSGRQPIKKHTDWQAAKEIM